MDDREKAIRRKLRDDFEHYAAKCLKIRTKAGAILPFAINTAQQYIHERLEEQLQTTGRIRAMVLKGRQQGCSTLVSGRFYHKVSHRHGVRAFILSHEEESAKTLFQMVKRYHEHCPAAVKPHSKASNAKELIFDILDSGYEIGTAGNKGVGRSKTLQYFHGSEVAFWPNAVEHLRGVMQCVSNEPGTEIILESTSNGAQGVFYEMWQAASAGQSPYIAIFVPWFWQGEYREPIPDGFELSNDEQEYAGKYGLDSEQMAWRRAKIVELNGDQNFRREYPATAEEAFKADAEGALWDRDTINKLRVHKAPELVRVVIPIDPAVTSNADSCETGIVPVGLGVDGHGYVLDDVSGRYTPNEWASKGVKAYYVHQADRIIGEVNNGGDLVEVNIRTVDQNVPYQAVHASRGKRSRAEPISALYDQGRVHHVGTHSTLEDQMVTWEPAKSDWSPDRIDALVWGLWALMLEPEEPKRRAAPTIIGMRTH